MRDLHRLIIATVLLVATAEGGAAGALSLLYAPAEGDDPALRDAISAELGGGAQVDYFDAMHGSPSPNQLRNYDCVFTWRNFDYADNRSYGDALATVVDENHVVILGQFAIDEIHGASTRGLDGRIIEPGYSPVVFVASRFSTAFYSGDGVSCLYDDIAPPSDYSALIRSELALQGDGIADGTFDDGVMVGAFRPDLKVISLNGAGGSQIASGPSTARLVANACKCGALGAVPTRSGSWGSIKATHRTP